MEAKISDNYVRKEQKNNDLPNKITSKQNYYQRLNLRRTSTAAEIRRAHRLLALKYHPDKNGGSTNIEFHLIQEAYQVLQNPTKRYQYDEYLAELGSRIRNDIVHGENTSESMADFETWCSNTEPGDIPDKIEISLFSGILGSIAIGFTFWALLKGLNTLETGWDKLKLGSSSLKERIYRTDLVMKWLHSDYDTIGTESKLASNRFEKSVLNFTWLI